MLTRLAFATALVLLTACASAPVVDMKILSCPRERITKPDCVKPPPSGTKRDQANVFGNELGCWRRVTAWEASHADCEGKIK